MLSLPKNFPMLSVELELNLNFLVRPEPLDDLSLTTLPKLPIHSFLLCASASMAFFSCSSNTLNQFHQQSFCATIFLCLEHSSCHQDFDFFDYDFFSKSIQPPMSTTLRCYISIAVIIIDILFIYSFVPMFPHQTVSSLRTDTVSCLP